MSLNYILDCVELQFIEQYVGNNQRICTIAAIQK
jgi:hypothetical protein